MSPLMRLFNFVPLSLHAERTHFEGFPHLRAHKLSLQ